MRLILASSSAGRKKILESLGLKFKVISPDIDEEKFTAINPAVLVKKIARAKATAILVKIKGASLIIAADSMVVLDGKIYGKPKNKEEAKKYLNNLSGNTHKYITGLYIINTKTKKVYQRSCKTLVCFKKFTRREINNYVRNYDVTSYAGGYSTGIKIIKSKTKLIGSESNVVGLPLEKLIPLLKKNQVPLPRKFFCKI